MRVYGLIGYPLGHSFSQGYFRRKFEAEETCDADYLNFPIRSIDKIWHVLMENPELMGLNVTIPYKQSVIPYLDEIDPIAKKIGAVNAIKIEREQDVRLIGYNTDYIGFQETLKPLLKIHHTKALILGTGGASKAVAYVLGQLGINFQYVSRNSRHTLGYNDLNKKVIQSHLLIINTTPVGMHPEVDTCPDLPYQYLTPSHVLYDMVYNPRKTLFLQKGEDAGATTQNGLEMLRIQAEKSWEIWNG